MVNFLWQKIYQYLASNLQWTTNLLRWLPRSRYLGWFFIAGENSLEHGSQLTTINSPCLDETNLDGIVKYIKSGKCKNIITLVGAGISTSAGIPDSAQLSELLSKSFKIDDFPSHIFFEGLTFHQSPGLFYFMAIELYFRIAKPSLCHYFIRLLQEKGLLLHHITTNVDTLERLAGIHEDKLVEMHGSLCTARCVFCSTQYDMQWVKGKISSGQLPPSCEDPDCGGIIRPDILLSGDGKTGGRICELEEIVKWEILPKCDLLIVIGTTLLSSPPFPGFVRSVPTHCPRLLIDKKWIYEENTVLWHLDEIWKEHWKNECFDPNNMETKRDVFWQGMSDDACQLLADKLGWSEELEQLMKRENEKIDAEKINADERSRNEKSTIKE